MTTLYVCSFLIGGFFVALAAFGGLDGPNFDIDFEVDLLGRGASAAPADPAVTLLDRLNALVPLTSLRFWTLTAFIFGLSGLVFSLLTDTSPLGTLAISATLGLLVGGAGANLLRWLGQDDTDSLVRSEDFVGAAATVELPFDSESRGKIKLELRGNYLYYPARTSEACSFAIGDRVLVVGVEDGIAWVVSETSIDRGALVGATAQVTVPFNHQHRGRIQVNLDGTLLSLQAIAQTEQEFEEGDRVVIQDLKTDCVLVVAAPPPR